MRQATITSLLGASLSNDGGNVFLCVVALWDRESKDSRRIQSKYVGTLPVRQMNHGTLDCRGGVGPCPFVVGVIIGPHEIVNESVFAC